MKTSILSLLALSALSAATTSELEERQPSNNLEGRQLVEGIEILIGGIIAGSSGALKSWLGPDTPACVWKNQNKDAWWTRLVSLKDGKNVTIAEVCWNGGGYKFNDGDVDVANCVVDLHTNQDFSCIDVEGSSCNNHPGTAVGNVRLLHGLDTKAHQQLPKDVGDIAKAAISKFKDLDHGWDLNTNFDMLPMKDNGEYYGWTVQVRGTGDLNC